MISEVIFIISLALNLIWEYSHFPLYIDLTNIPKDLHLIIASITDALIITITILIIKFINKRKRLQNKDYLLTSLITLIVAVLIEIYALKTGRWGYTISMPKIFGIGLSPLIQLFATTIISLTLVKIVNKKRLI